MLKNTLDICQLIITRTSEIIEDFIAGKMPENYTSTQLSKDLSAETGINLSLVAPLVSLHIKNDGRIESNRGRYNGGLRVKRVVKLLEE